MEPMKISELVAQLTEFMREHGDRPIYLEDADTGWTWKGKPSHFYMDDDGLHISGDYGDERAA